jgi:hypothetical protein
MKTLFFDIETEPRPDDELIAILPPFDPTEVALGNLKDPDKIAAKVAEAEASYFPAFRDKAALSAATGRVVAIGCLIHDTNPNGALPVVHLLDCAQDEKAGVATFGRMLREVMDSRGVVVGFNSKAFDLPFLARRAWMLQVLFPTRLLIPDFKWWAKNQVFDLREMWLLGDNREKSSLNHVAQCLGLGQKTGDHGKHFGKMWRSTVPSERQSAEEYLRQDVRLLQPMWERMANVW